MAEPPGYLTHSWNSQLPEQQSSLSLHRPPVGAFTQAAELSALLREVEDLDEWVAGTIL
jgi:hypothetical protein